MHKRRTVMFHTQSFKIIFISLTTLFFSACSSLSPTAPPLPPQVTQETVQVPVPSSVETPKTQSLNNQIDISQKGPLFHSAIKDGCATAKGKYTKNATLYTQDTDYKEGWFYGRRQCQPHR